MSYINNVNTINGFTSISGFGNTFLCTNAINANKTVTFPDGYNQDLNISFKVIFKNGHRKTTSDNMTLNNIPVVVNKYGTLTPIPNHEITTGNFSTLQPNTVLEMYYTNNYDGNNNPAFVVIGNPVVVSDIDYTIYADGKVGDEPVCTIKPVMSQNFVPYGWLLCDGIQHSNTEHGGIYYNLWNNLPSHMKSGNNFTVDLRELVLVGAGYEDNYLNVQFADHIQIHEPYIVGEFRDDQIQSHYHYMGHVHDKGAMRILGNVYNVFGSNNGSTAYNEGDFRGDGPFRTSASVSSGGMGGGSSWYIRQRNIAFDTNNASSWTGYTSTPLTGEGVPTDYTDRDSARHSTTWDVTHGKQIGVRYIIKW